MMDDLKAQNTKQIVDRDFHRKVDPATLTLPKVEKPDLNTVEGATMSSLMSLLTAWESGGKLPFTKNMLVQHFPQGAPLKAVFLALLGKEVSRWEDYGLTGEQSNKQIVACQLAEVLITQLKIVADELDNAEDVFDYGKAVGEMSDASRHFVASVPIKASLFRT